MIDIAALTFDDQSLRTVLDHVDLLEANRQTCDEFVVLFGRYAENQDPSDASRFLAIVCGMRLRPDMPEDPLEPAFRISGRQTPTWTDITEVQLQAIASIIPMVSHVELIARLADILWLRQRTHEHARIAANAYWMSGREIVVGKHVLGERERLTRALQLAACVGRNEMLFDELIENVTKLSEMEGVLDCSAFTCMEILLNFQGGDTLRLYTNARERALSHVKADRNSIWERNFWNLAARFANRNRDHEAARNAMIEVARTFEREAENAPSQLVAASFWKQAVHTYRSISGTAKEREHAHAMLTEAQRRGCSEFVRTNIEAETSPELGAASRARVRGMKKSHAIATLLSAWHIPSKTEILAEAESTIRQHPLAFLFPTERLSNTGKTTATAPNHVPGSSDVAQELVNAQACEVLECQISVIVDGIIRPMCQEIDLQYAVLFEDIYDFVRYSPFIPNGRLEMFAIGIHAGFHGRFIEALHVLIPQLEHLLRCLLEENGVRTSTLNDAGIQDEFNLNSLLRMKETESILGDNLCHCLRVLLIERHGAMTNLRNRMAHGMLSSSAYFCDNAIFTWWLIWKMVCGSVAESVLSERSFVDGDQAAD